MIATQYKIVLSSDYDMNIIRERVKNNGHKTNNFDGLKFKFYLISEKDKNKNIQNSYSPLYLWNDIKGLNKFLFEGYYDNIINSFGWQKVNVGISLIDTTTENLKNTKYIFEVIGDIKPQNTLNNLPEKLHNEIPKIEGAEYIIIYNPDKWKYHVIYFLNDVKNIKKFKGEIYEVLYVSQ